jgi:hypothetical protein
MQLTLQDIIRMMGNPSTGMKTEGDMLRESKNAMEIARQKDQQIQNYIAGGQAGMATDADIARMLSLPAAENMPNYANNEMPLYTGGLLENPQGQMVDPQMLMNTAYDMSAPREMRINAIERLRALGVI